MLLKYTVLFLAPLLSGLLIFLVPSTRTKNFRLLLVFAGSYLFAITVTHILPELFRSAEDLHLTGILVLAGFFLQQVLEYFTSGIEHGHIHQHGHGEKKISAIMLLSALCLHAFLEGGILAEPRGFWPGYDPVAILIGIALHRAPAAFALMAVLAAQLQSRQRAVPYLLFFSLAAPAGLFLSNYFANADVLNGAGMMAIYALVSGNFLHISTTIVFESSPDHHFNAKRLLVAVLGATTAVVVELLV
jgi:zinc transporter ZupT